MDITSNNRLFFSGSQFPSPFQLYRFGRTVYEADKYRELLSYIRWEIKHRLRLFHNNNYLKFTHHDPIILNTSSVVPFQGPSDSSINMQPALKPWRMIAFSSSTLVWGCLFDDDFTLYVSLDNGHSFEVCHQFDNPIQSIFVTARRQVFVCCSGIVYRSVAHGQPFQKVLTLSSSNSYFLFNNGMTELPDGRLLLGEYGVVRTHNSWQNLAHIYFSNDQGDSWQKSDFLIQDGVNKHVHLVKYSKYLNAIFLTDGDNKKQVWINRSSSNLGQPIDPQGHGWHRLNNSHYQLGGYLSMDELNGKVFLGSDYLGGTNFMVTTTDGITFDRQIIPDPYRRSPIMNMVARITTDKKPELWAVLHNSISSTTRSLLMVSTDLGRSWRRIIDYDGTQHEIKLVSSATRLTDQLYVAIISKQGEQYRHSTFTLLVE